jgi:hypothetical protein
MTLIVLQFAIQYASLLNAILHVLNPRMLYVMLNVKNQNVKLNALIKDVKCLTAPNVLPYANNLTVLLTVKLLNLNANQYVKNPSVTGNAINLTVLNQNVN